MLTINDIRELENRFKDLFLTKDEFQRFRSDLFDKLDYFIGEISDSREERIVAAGQISDLSDRVEKLETV